jgi:acetyl-CoA carboxylase biotin carboxyl carrier protein
MKVIKAHITGSVWKIMVKVGDKVSEGDVVSILESMKMEMPVEAEEAGEIAQVMVQEGQAITEGSPMFALK